MVQTAMEFLVALPRWQQFIVAVIAVVAIAELVSRIVSRTLARSRTTFFRFNPSMEEAPDHHRESRHDHHHAGETAPPNLRLDDPKRPPAIVDSSGRARTICPCCGYPTAREVTEGTGCLLCDWNDPLSTSPEPAVARSEYASALARAGDNLAQFGSAIAPDERSATSGDLSNHELRQRETLRALFDYLMSADHPGAAETWAQVDDGVARLQSLERGRLERMPKSG